MTERIADNKILKREAVQIVERLRKVTLNHERTFPSSIQAVLVFSGPGTYYDRLKPNQEEWKRWMDRDRIRAGVAIIRDITAQAKSEVLGRRVQVRELTKEDILNFGPTLVYNGTPLENNVFRRALDSRFCKLPKEKVIVIDTVQEEDGGIHQICHTGDQVKSFYQHIKNPQSKLYNIRNLALVAHSPDYIRIPFYTKKYNDEYVGLGEESVNFWVYGLKSRPGTEKIHLQNELERLVSYAKRGDLALDPSPFQS